MPIVETNRNARPRIALFRARGDAARTAAGLRALNFSVACTPVIEIVPMPFAPAKALYDAVIATSAKAFLAEAPIAHTSPLYVVGARTANAAKARGWSLVVTPAGDAAGLIQMLKCRLVPGASVLYLAGRDRKSAVEAAFAELFALEVVETYTAEAREAWRPVEVRALASCVAAVHYSHRSAALAAGLAEQAGIGAHFLGLVHSCLSRSAAEPLRAIGAAHVLIADEPNEPSLFAAVARFLRVFPSDMRSRI